jgi:biotin-(acetyl-CoA carboxylase) ligase
MTENPEWRRKHAALLGKRVRVRLDDQVVTEGRFLGFGADGEFEIQHSDGLVHYCWPMLDVEEVSGG